MVSEVLTLIQFVYVGRHLLHVLVPHNRSKGQLQPFNHVPLYSAGFIRSPLLQDKHYAPSGHS